MKNVQMRSEIVVTSGFTIRSKNTVTIVSQQKHTLSRVYEKVFGLFERQYLQQFEHSRPKLGKKMNGRRYAILNEGKMQ